MQSFSVNDGEGIRTVIFLPGCPLRCRWCANPEAWTASPKLAVSHAKCIGCGACEAACPASLFPPRLESPAASGCSVCGACVKVCPAGALKILIQEMSVAEAARRVERDALFFRYSGGGVTFSGGEPTAQAGFLRALAREFDSRGFDMALETCGFFVWDEVEDVLALMSHVFYDLKHMDAAVHRELTGAPNELILENCRRLSRLGIPITVRIPVIKAVNDTKENLEAVCRFMTENLPGASIELLPYHDFGREKYRAVGLANQRHDGYVRPEAHEMEAAEDLFRRRGTTVVRYR
jgi:pyruvate formate lyase activating enzyme